MGKVEKTPQQSDKQGKAGRQPQRDQPGRSDRQHSQATKEDPEQSGLTRGGDPKSKNKN